MNIEKDEKMQACFQYFMSAPVLKKLLTGFVDKYRSFGMACGNVVLRNITSEDIEILEGLTGKNYHGKKSASVSSAAVQKALEQSRFQGIILEDLLAVMCVGELKSKKEEQEIRQDNYRRFYRSIAGKFADTKSGEWMERILSRHTAEERILQQRYKEDDGSLEKDMMILLEALNHLPAFCKEMNYLPAFAAQYAGDPHHFDEGRPDTLLFLYGIYSILCAGDKKEIEKPFGGMNAEQKHTLLLEAGLIRDSMSNDAMVYGIRGCTREGEHRGLAGFYQQKEPLSLTLFTIMKLESVQCNQKCVYAVENPIVFAKLIEQTDISAVCTNGQPNLAVLQLLDRIARAGADIYYNGDFDPEGLGIAERLKKRYQQNLIFWHYEEQDFRRALSDQTISDKRMKMLNALVSPKLKTVAEWIRQTGRAGYQERIFFGENG